MAGNKFNHDILHRITGVSWGGGLFVLITAKAFYEFGSLGSRTAKVTLTAAGTKAGGKIIDQKLWHVAELDDGSAEAHPAYTLLRAVISFSSAPKDIVTAFYVDLTGSISRADPVQPPPSNQPFCGTTNTRTVYSSIYAKENPIAVGTFNFFQDISSSYSTPAGTSTSNWTSGPLADHRIEDVGTGGATIAASSNSIWYRDAYGNYINTNRVCEELPPTGSPPVPATRIEGFNLLSAWVYPRSLHFVLPPKDWKPELPDDAFVIGPAGGFGTFMATVPQVIAGLNSDFGPLYDDLSSGKYEWRLMRLSYRNLPRDKPDDWFTTFAAIPLTPPHAKYHVIITTVETPPQPKPPATPKPPTLRAWAPPKEVPIPGATQKDEKFFQPAEPPPGDQTFVELK